jgi:hypothetical protein
MSSHTADSTPVVPGSRAAVVIIILGGLLLLLILSIKTLQGFHDKDELWQSTWYISRFKLTLV